MYQQKPYKHITSRLTLPVMEYTKKNQH